LVIHDQPREPQPGSADEAEQLAIGSYIGLSDPAERERRGRDVRAGRLGHFEVGDDRREFRVRDRFVAHVHFANGGRLIRIASMFPPVLRPNKVPRS
jgi:hypothetical protein